VAGLISALGIEWGQLLAASALLMLPMILFVVFAQRYLVEGLTMGLK
jgi:ABC-type glycerol-3-phosphate transport system permease component